MKKRIVLVSLLALTLCGCNKNSTSMISSVSSSLMSINCKSSDITLMAGQHYDASKLFSVVSGDKSLIRYSSLDENKLIVDSITGEAIALGSGQVEIKAYLESNENIYSKLKVIIQNGDENVEGFNYYIFDSFPGRKHSLCSLGTQNILVLPIEIKGFEGNATKSNLERINKLFNEQDNSEWESVSSFYDKSSYNQLHLNFLVPDEWYKCDLTPSEIYNRKIEDDGGTAMLIEEGASWYKDKYKENVKLLDGDNDGFIDAIWAVFSAPSTLEYDYSLEYPDINPTMFWPLTVSSYLNMSDSGNKSNPLPKVYSWASFDFMDKYEKVGTIDAHTYIHETGHMLGLKDYYSYGGGFETPLGCIDMMDCNIGDHNPMSKFALGWIKPKVVNEPMVIELKPFEKNGEFIVLGDEKYNNTAFDEYFTIDYLTPEGLNEHDYKNVYEGNGLQGYSQSGIRIMHIDNRCTDSYGKFVSDPMKFVNDPISNTSYQGYTKFFDSAMARPMFQATLMQKNFFEARRNVLSASNTYFNALVGNKVDANEALFHEGECFDLSASSNYCDLMPSKSDRLNKYAQGRNSEDVFPYRIKVIQMDSQKAVVEISKV